MTRFLPVLLKAAQHREIALIQYRTAVPVDVVSGGRSSGSGVNEGRAGGNQDFSLQT
jgi:hypothetical protein